MANNDLSLYLTDWNQRLTGGEIPSGRPTGKQWDGNRLENLVHLVLSGNQLWSPGLHTSDCLVPLWRSSASVIDADLAWIGGSIAASALNRETHRARIAGDGCIAGR